MVIIMLSAYYLAEQSGFTDNYGDDRISRFLEKGLPTALLGIVTVFVVLALIWGSLELFRYFFYTLPKKRGEAGENKDAADKPETKTDAPEFSAGDLPEEFFSDDGEVVAAIIAAITAARSESAQAPAGFRVVSFRRK